MNQKGFAHIIALIAIIILLGGIGAYFILNRQAQPTQAPPPTPISVAPTPGPIIMSGDPYSLPVQNVCIPVSRPGDPVVMRDLGDGTYIYQRSDGTLFRGNQNQCRCLAAQALISTPDGPKVIKDLAVGMYVYTRDRKGNRVTAPLVRVSKVSVPDDYVIFRLLLSDGRKLLVSGAHPTADRRTIEELRNYDNLDGARILKKELILYGDSFTYDILPAGDSGLYWANDILLKSTLAE